jgi:MMP endo-(1,4)-3-O-methyl-alpha-D-mannosidase
MTPTPPARTSETTPLELAGVIDALEADDTARHLASLQLDSGMIPWYPGGHCDPWNHVESAMALDVAGRHADAERAYGWLVQAQRADGSWHNYYRSDGTVEETKLDTNVCAYIATGVWHHWLCTGDLMFVDQLWPTVDRALGFVLSLRRPDGLPLWAIEPDARPWGYALLTGSASIQHALRCGADTADLLGIDRHAWRDAADTMAGAIRDEVDRHPDRHSSFEPKTRWAMDWYYPVLTGVLCREDAKTRLTDRWEAFAMEGHGIRCVSDEPWVTASETAECAIAFAAIGDLSTATDLLRWTRTHRRDDGSYWTGVVYPERVMFPFDEHTSYTAAALLLAVDAITGSSPAARIFVPPSDD